jgi:hypothetical protein
VHLGRRWPKHQAPLPRRLRPNLWLILEPRHVSVEKDWLITAAAHPRRRGVVGSDVYDHASVCAGVLRREVAEGGNADRA